MEEYKGPNPETEHDHHYGCAPIIPKKREPEYYVLPLNEALEDYEEGCESCEKMRNFIQINGLTEVIMSDHHMVSMGFLI